MAGGRLLVSGAVGPGGDVLHRRRTLEDVRRTLGHHLDKIFAGDRGAQP
ncbi:hypothetical protein ACFW1M_13595 [Streptomyces inhibens]